MRYSERSQGPFSLCVINSAARQKAALAEVVTQMQTDLQGSQSSDPEDIFLSIKMVVSHFSPVHFPHPSAPASAEWQKKHPTLMSHTFI